jgi:uncharacterized protein (TIGR02145 family)
MKELSIFLFSLLIVFTCYSSNLQISPTDSIDTITDIEGNVYHTVIIGAQTWMVENLKTTKLNDGTSVTNVIEETTWANLTTPGLCWYDNNSENKSTYGALYNWYAVNTGKLAPKGWHVPTDTEWRTLTNYLGGNKVAGGKLKEIGTTHWNSPNKGATNESGFSAIPGGTREVNRPYYGIHQNGYWWSSTIGEYRYLGFDHQGIDSSYDGAMIDNGLYKKHAFSVRCIKDYIGPNANAGPDQSINQGADVILDGSSSFDNEGKLLTFKWIAPPGISLSSTTVAKPTFTAPTVTEVTEYVFKLIVNNGTVDSPEDQVVVTILNINQQMTTKKIQPTCLNPTGTIEITSPLGSEYEYSIGGSVFQNSPIFTNLTWGTYILKTRNINTLNEYVSNNVVINAIPPTPKIKSAWAEDCICYGGNGSITLEFENVANGIYTIYYLGGKFQNVMVRNNLAYVVANAGIYENLKIEANGCISDGFRSVAILEPQQLSVTATIWEIDLVSGQKGKIQLAISGGSGNYQFLWQPNPQNGFVGANTKEIDNLNSGDYFATITDQNGCTIAYSFTIPVPNQSPIATNDEFVTNCNKVSGNLISSDNGHGMDSDPDGDPFYIVTTPILKPSHGLLTLNQDGSFTYRSKEDYTGIDIFQYAIYDVRKNYSIPATVTIHVFSELDCGGIEDGLYPTNLMSKGFSVYPNPTSGIVNIEMPQNAKEKTDVTILNTVGSIVIHKEFSNTGNFQIDLSNLKSGIYFLNTQNNGSQYRYKIIVRNN